MNAAKLVGERLPALVLPEGSAAEAAPEVSKAKISKAEASKAAVRLRPHSRDATVAILLPPHPPDLEGYFRSLSDAEAEMRRWDGRVLVVAEGEPPKPRFGRVASDPEGRLRRRLGLARETVAAVIADRFGEIFHAVEAEPGARPETLPSPGELLEWLKYLTTQCPECGVIDAPGYGEWAAPEDE